MNSDFKVFALVVVKNEADIIIDTIEAATVWADKIFIIDNMSTDSTWQHLLALENKYSNVILWGQYGGRFNEGLRQILFRDFRCLSNEGDWWCRLDGDEFYIDNPKSFLESVPSEVDHVYNASFQYYFTEEDFLRECSIFQPQKFENSMLQWYKCNHSEIRFVKNKKSICWPQEEGWPCNLLNASVSRIRLKHYQYRTTAQIKSRLNIRSEEVAGDMFKHEIVDENNWYKRRGFSKPISSEMRKVRVVNKLDLTNADDYTIIEGNLPKIAHKNLKKIVKCSFVALYMRFFNKFLFKL